MSAPMTRLLSNYLHQHLCRLRHCRTILKSRAISTVNDDGDLDDVDPDHFNNKTVPYFPEEERISSLQAKYPEVTISSEEFKYVKRVLPPMTVPLVPEGQEYPTPSGWVPPYASKQPIEYGIGRTRNDMLPVYLEQHHTGRISTIVKKVHGDIHKLNTDIQDYLQKNGVAEETLVQIHEVGHFLRYKGNHVRTIGAFCLEKGF